jgi:hypothetical protein
MGFWGMSRQVPLVLGRCLVGLVVVVVAVAWPSVSGAAVAHGAGVKVEACRSTYPTVGKHPVPVVIAPDASPPKGFVFYANQALSVLAPSGWKCRGAVGVDGSGQVDVTGSSGQTIEGIEGSVCAGCNFDIACPLFPAAKALQPELGCPSTPPADERLYKLSKIAIAFEDPPGIRGTGQPSGGRYPANGVVIYSPGPPDQAFKETCTLPGTAHTDCAAVLNDFTARYTAGL